MTSAQTSANDLTRRVPLAAFAGLNAIGLLATTAIGWIRPHWWATGFLAAAVAAVGLWGIAERALMDLEFRGFPPGAKEYGPYSVLGELARIIAIVTAIVFAVFGPVAWFFGQIGVGGG